MVLYFVYLIILIITGMIHTGTLKYVLIKVSKVSLTTVVSNPRHLNSKSRGLVHGSG